jgi:hypothetical protein
MIENRSEVLGGGFLNNMTRRVVLLAALVVGLCSSRAYATPTATLFPTDGNVTGFPGTTVGWGVSILNTSDTVWLIITGSQFCGSNPNFGDPNSTDCSNNLPPGPYVPYDGVTQFGTSFGIYTDYLLLAGIVLAPFEQGVDTYTSNPFSPGSPGTGVGQYAIFANVKPGVVDVGNIFVTFDMYNGDPNNGGSFTTSGEVSLGVNVNVVPTPEPSTFVLAGAALALLGGLRMWRRLVG